MQYISSRNMSSIATPKIHKVMDSPIDSAPWMQSSSTSNADHYYSSSSANNSHNNNANSMMTDADADVYMSDTSKSNRSRNSTTDMCVEKNTEGKPPYSYATLIKYAIERSSENKLTLSQIYQWVIDHYPYYGSAGSGWKNSIRHNLSLNKSFVRVPRPVNEPGKGSYWTVDQFAVDTEQRVRTNVRGRSSRSSSDSSLHHRASNNNNGNGNNNNNDPWLLGLNNVNHRNFRDGRSLSTDAGVASSSASALRRTSQYGYCGHPYGSYERNFNQPQYGYPNYHPYGQQRMPSHETILSARQHSSVTYSLPASATIHHHQHSQSTPYSNNGYNAHSNNNMYSSTNMNTQQQPFYSHRQSCPDLTSISPANYSETNSILPNFNTTGNEVCLEQSSVSSSMCDNKLMYTNHHHSNNTFTSTNSYSSSNEHQNKSFASSSSSSPIKGNTRSNDGTAAPMSSFFKDFDKQQQQRDATANVNPTVNTPGLPSPVLSPSNCSSTTSSQHLSAVDPLSVVTQHPSPVTTTAATTASSTAPGNRLTSPYHRLALRRTTSSSNSVVEECLTSPSSPMVMANENNTSTSPMSTTLDGGVRSPVPFCIDSVAYIDMVSQQQQQQQNASLDDHSLSSSSSSQHDVCSPQPSMEGNEYKFNSHHRQQEKYSQIMSSNNTTATAAGSFDYSNL